MSAHQVFCSHCGQVQMAHSASGHFYLHCASCQALTIVLGANWKEFDLHAIPTIPLAPSISYQETEMRCMSCEAALNLEFVVRSHAQPCVRCSDFGNLSLAVEGDLRPPVQLSSAEINYLSGEIGS